ncbi:uncharacterized protein LOC34622302 [Cyclospora cayetanensis]|uniref:Uncharacterized protein LOC34622302 n=1 Tax=Cyclospora cayetanensis TaxID=88456 RepID=A0A6P6RRK6_9EIME|nr:uncharacterized protein LOC34622302 [Cyclospora cayetanensis]
MQGRWWRAHRNKTCIQAPHCRQGFQGPQNDSLKAHNSSPFSRFSNPPLLRLLPWGLQCKSAVVSVLCTEMRDPKNWHLPLLLVVILGLMGCSEGQIRLQSPKRLFDKLVAMKAISEETFYTLTGSTASFGTPTYGTILRGRAFYTPDPRRVEADGTEAGFHCDSSYCSSLKSEIDSWKANELHGGLGHIHGHRSLSTSSYSRGDLVPLPTKISGWDAFPLYSSGNTQCPPFGINSCDGAASVFWSLMFVLCSAKTQRMQPRVFWAACSVLQVVLFVDRGICTFAAKVEVAQGCGADAVVIVDHGTQEWTRETIRHNIIMSDDGKVRNIRIPSILVSKQDGEAFKEEIVSGEEPVLVELEWRMPSQWPVAVNFWADSGDVKEELCLSEGLYSKYPRLYCSFEPNAQVLGLTGSEVVQEALLESCLYWTTKTAPPGLKDAEFSREWWLYQQRLGDPRDGCSFDGEGKNAWGPTCSRRVLSEVLSGGQLRAVELCMADENGRRLLEFSKNNRGWTVVAVTINGARYSGQLTPESVLRAICSATAHPLTNKYRSEACNSIVVDSHTQGAPWLRANLDWRSFFFVLFLVVVICVGLSYLYYRYAKQQFVDRMQRRVQHEVQQQLQLYHRMEEPTPRKPAAAECNRLV